MSELRTIRCVGCEGGIAPLDQQEVKDLLKEVKNWAVSSDGKYIYKRYQFKGFYKTMSFANAIAWIANQENHHPDLEIGFNYCVIKYTTHAVDGLTKNDFICASKIDALEAESL